MTTASEPGTLRLSFCDDGGMPVMGSSLVLSWVMVHDGVMRRSEAAFSDITWSGMSAMIVQYRELLVGGCRRFPVGRCLDSWSLRTDFRGASELATGEEAQEQPTGRSVAPRTDRRGENV